MIVTRLFEPAIAQASYLIGCAATGEALIIDPNRNIDTYIQAAARDGLRIAHVTETHIHADFVSGARELAATTGAALYLSDEGDANWKYQYGIPADGGDRAVCLLRDGDRIDVGRIRVDVVATPGHTPEHLTFLVTDTAAADAPIAAATGDFVFVGDVGRPDLLERAAKIAGTMEQGARTLWASLRMLERYEDWLQIWPGHGAGSACGKGISAVPSSTLGYERRFNWAFQVRDEDVFVERVLAGQPEPPAYFAAMKRVNKAGPSLLGGRSVPPPVLDDARLSALVAADAIVVDTGAARAFAVGHLRGTLNLPLNSSFVTWAGWLLPYDADLYFILDDPAEERRIELARQLALIGLDRVAGVFDRGTLGQTTTLGAAPGTVAQMSPAELSTRLAAGDVTLIDVRRATEWAHGHVPGATHIPLGHLAERLAEVPTDRPVVVQCQGGGRSSIAAALLQRLGRAHVFNLAGGITAWERAGLSIEK